MVTNTTIYTRQIYCCLNTDSLNVEFRNGDEVILMDQNVRMIFDEDNQTFHSIPMGGGGGGNLITKTITANGTYAASSDNADGYSSVTVAVPEPVDGLIAGTWPSGAVSTAATGTLRAYAFYNNTAMTAFSGPNISSVGNYAFYGNTALSVVHLPEVETVGDSAFQYAHVEYLVLPSCHTLGATSVKGSSNHKVLKALDLGGEITDSSQGIRGTYVFGDRGNQFNTVILRSGAVVPLANTNSFNGTAFYTGLGPSTIYVPQALIDAYTNATNWSTVIARTNVTISAIEGSVYETQYADGTPIA